MAFKDQATKVKYNNDFSKQAYDHIHLTVPKGQKAAIQAHAQAMGESTNSFIARAIENQMAQDSKKEA
ncbi:MAG: hypothetical protein LUG44_05600 [Clostridiales bacterium]|nr:hypothetical protein [Clostridiales bacterium]